MLYKIKLKRPESKTSSLMVTFMKNGVPYKFYTGKTIHSKIGLTQNKKFYLKRKITF